MALGGPGLDRYGRPSPPVRRSSKPPKVWGAVHAEDETLVVRLQGWRVVWATKRTLRVPLHAVVAVDHDPFVHQRVSTRLRRRSRRPKSASLFKVGAYHSLEGWSFWACGMARNAVVIETSGARYRFIVVEVADPATVVAALREAAGLAPEPSPKVRSIRDSPRKKRPDAPGAPRLVRPRPGSEATGPDAEDPRPDPTRVAPGPFAGDLAQARRHDSLRTSDRSGDTSAEPDPA